MNSMKKITIIIPVYNTESYIGGTITSLTNQTSSDFNLILVDDGSPDRAMEIASEMLMRSTIQYQIIRERNSGLGAARNLGYEKALGEWVMFIDSDDIVQPFLVESYLELIQKEPKADIICSRYRKVWHHNLSRDYSKCLEYAVLRKEEMLFDYLTRRMKILLPGTAFKRDYLQRCGIMHDNLKWSEDQYFMWNALSNADCLVYSRSITYDYLIRGKGSIMNSTNVMDMIEASKEFERLPKKLNNETVRRFLLPRWHFGCLHVLARRGDYASWNQFYEATCFNDELKTLVTFPSRSVRIIAMLGKLNKKLLFSIMRLK